MFAIKQVKKLALLTIVVSNASFFYIFLGLSKLLQSLFNAQAIGIPNNAVSIYYAYLELI